MEKMYYILTNDDAGNLSNQMLADLKKHPNVTFLCRHGVRRNIQNPLLHKFLGICARLRWALERPLAFRELRRRSCWNRVHLILPNEALFQITASQLNRLQKDGVCLTMLLIDPISGNYPSVRQARVMLEQVHFDYILTFDPQDALNNGWIYTNTLYSKHESQFKELMYDLIYIGSVKNRLATCQTLLEQIEKHKVKAWFKLLCDDQQAQQLPAHCHLKQYMLYPKVVELIQSAGCILDMTQQKQSGITLRYYEAVVYNKKLLTNNKNITQLPFYNSRYMRLYEQPEDIDWTWVKSADMPDYGYNGQFSPVHILELLT